MDFFYGNYWVYILYWSKYGSLLWSSVLISQHWIRVVELGQTESDPRWHWRCQEYSYEFSKPLDKYFWNSLQIESQERLCLIPPSKRYSAVLLFSFTLWWSVDFDVEGSPLTAKEVWTLSRFFYNVLLLPCGTFFFLMIGKTLFDDRGDYAENIGFSLQVVFPFTYPTDWWYYCNEFLSWLNANWLLCRHSTEWLMDPIREDLCRFCRHRSLSLSYPELVQ